MDFEARRIVEALRSGVPSRAAGQYFSSARQDIISLLSGKLDETREKKTSGGIVVSGAYGEGKTHLLNTVFNIAHSNNMVCSFISLSRETPFDRMHLVYPKLVHNTFLPKRLQPGFLDILSDITPGSPLATEMLLYTVKHLEIDKLYYLFRSYLNTDDTEEKYLLLADLEGDFINNALLKKTYRRIFSEKAGFNVSFSKTKHMDNYLSMLSRLFLQLGYNGWVILFDESELIGKLGKKARLNAYKNMSSFLFPENYSRLQSTYSIFAITDSYLEDVIESKREFENLSQSGFEPKSYEAAEKALNSIISAPKLQQLNKDEILGILNKLKDFYMRAYDLKADIDMREIIKSTENRGYLLRTRIRAAVECLDQLYQYNKLGDIKINELGQVSYEEDIPSLDEMM